MRSLFLVLAIAVLAAIALVASGLVSIHQTRPAVAPTIERSGGAVKAVGGQTPDFAIETGSVGLKKGTANVSVPVPALQINRPDRASPPANSAAPAQ